MAQENWSLPNSILIIYEAISFKYFRTNFIFILNYLFIYLFIIIILLYYFILNLEMVMGRKFIATEFIKRYIFRKMVY
jgi:hypothetical protein